MTGATSPSTRHSPAEAVVAEAAGSVVVAVVVRVDTVVVAVEAAVTVAVGDTVAAVPVDMEAEEVDTAEEVAVIVDTEAAAAVDPDTPGEGVPQMETGGIKIRV